MRTYMCESRGKKCHFFENFCVRRKWMILLWPVQKCPCFFWKQKNAVQRNLKWSCSTQGWLRGSQFRICSEIINKTFSTEINQSSFFKILKSWEHPLKIFWSINDSPSFLSSNITKFRSNFFLLQENLREK